MLLTIFFFFNDTATTEIYTSIDTLSLHDALPISRPPRPPRSRSPLRPCRTPPTAAGRPPSGGCWPRRRRAARAGSCGEHDGESGAAARGLGDGEGAAVGLDRLPHQGEAEARPVPLRRE